MKPAVFLFIAVCASAVAIQQFNGQAQVMVRPAPRPAIEVKPEVPAAEIKPEIPSSSMLPSARRRQRLNETQKMLESLSILDRPFDPSRQPPPAFESSHIDLNDVEKVCFHESAGERSMAASRIRMSVRAKVRSVLFSPTRFECTEDAVQASFVRLLSACERLNGKDAGRVASYVLKIAENAAKTCGRSVSADWARFDAIDEEFDMASPAVSAEASIITKQGAAKMKSDLHRLVEALTPNERLVLQGLVAEQAQAAIAQRMGIGEGRVSQLKKQIQKKWETLSQ